MLRLLAVIVALLVSCFPAFGQTIDRTPTTKAPIGSTALISPIGPGVNFGNMLEGPFEGAWGFTVEERFFDAAVDSGMEHIRLPISWTYHTDTAAPYTIDPAFMERVEWCVDQALSRGLKIIVNVHHYDELNADPIGESPRALAMWEQIAARFANRSNKDVFFEVLNEPHGAFNDEPLLWDSFFTQALGVIRNTNPNRWVLVGPVRWNSIAALGTLNPPADRRLMLSVHHYEPFEFTHQGAEWVDPSPPVGTQWTGEPFVIATPWQNWSWGTGIVSEPNGLSIDYQEGWAGLAFRRVFPAANPKTVRFAVDRAMPLNVIVGNENTQQTFFVQTDAGGGVYHIELPTGMTTIDRVTLQNASSSAQPVFQLSSIEISFGKGSQSESLFETELGAIDASIRAAAQWARDRNMPAHLGEFGAYNPADIDSRVRWTRAVRASAERHGVAWAYWELVAGFGYFDPQTDAFRQPLLDALTD